MASHGFWFNLDTFEWEKKTPVPHRPMVPELPTPLYTFRNRPTFFGNQDCDNEGYCQYSEVIQYRSWTDTWEVIGKLNQGRTRQEVIMVPNNFCEGLDAPMSSTTDIPPTVQPTDSPSMTTMAPQFETVAMIIGGYAVGSEGDAFVELNTVEMYGCDGANPVISDLPIGMYQFSGAFLHDSVSDRVLVCGGYQCESGDLYCGDLSGDCYEWRPTDNIWRRTPALNEARRTHATVQVPDLDSEGHPVRPLVMGYTEMTEIFVEEDNEWREYRELDDRSWVNTGCIVQIGTKIYRIFDEILVLDAENGFEATFLADTPENFRNPGKCAFQEIDGEPGT